MLLSPGVGEKWKTFNTHGRAYVALFETFKNTVHEAEANVIDTMSHDEIGRILYPGEGG
jgi:hypothetical protein